MKHASFRYNCDTLFPNGFENDDQRGISASKRPVLGKDMSIAGYLHRESPACACRITATARMCDSAPL